MDVEDEGADQPDAQEPQERGAGRIGTSELAEELAVARSKLVASRPRYIFRLPTMWAKTKPRA